MVTAPLNSILVLRTEDKLDNRHNTARLHYSIRDTRFLPSEAGCNSSYNYASATWARSVHSSATKRYTTSFDATRCLRCFRIA